MRNGYARGLWLVGAIVVLSGAGAGCFNATPIHPASRLPPPPPEPAGASVRAADEAAPGDHFKRVLIIVLENQDYRTAMADDYLDSLARDGALFTHFRGLAHPSYPNYLAMVSGRLYHTHGDDQQDFPDQTLADSLTGRGLSWKNYAEGFPGMCFTGAVHRRYARKHVPFMSFLRVRHDQCDRVVDEKQFQADLTAGALPNYCFYSPDMDDDGHDTGLAYSSKWLKGFLEPFRHDPSRMKGLLIVVTYDESKHDPRGDPNHIYTVFLGDMVRPGHYDAPYNHFNVLRTIEDNFHLPRLAGGDGGAKPITEVWKN